MLLAIDVGNTNITLGLFKGRRLWRRYSIPTQFKSYSLPFKKILSRNKISGVIICSVVPKATAILAKNLKQLLGKKPVIVGKEVTVPIKNLYHKPRQVGSDRLVNAFAAVALYGAPLIVVDFGTAITFDVVSQRKEYLGGVILPGLQISLDCLEEKTALLPKIRLRKPKGLVGRDTQNSMLSGVVYGFGALADNLIVKIKKQIGKRATVIGTGGNINLIVGYCQNFDKIDRDLTLKGLNMVYQTHRSNLKRRL